MPNIIFSEGSNVANSAFGLAQAPIKSVILQQAQLWEDRMLYPKIAKQETSTHAMEQYSSFTDLGDYEAVGENGAYPSTGYQEGFKRIIENVTWKSQFAISQEAMEDATLPGVKQDKTVALFSHGGSSSAAIGRILNIPFPQTCALFHFGHTGITILRFEQEPGITSVPCIELLNDLAHIKNI